MTNNQSERYKSRPEVERAPFSQTEKRLTQPHLRHFQRSTDISEDRKWNGEMESGY